MLNLKLTRQESLKLYGIKNNSVVNQLTKQTYLRGRRGHWWAPGVWNPLKSLVMGPSLLVNCYLEIKFHKKIRVNTPPLNRFAWSIGLLRNVCQMFGQCLPNHLNMLTTMLWGALLVATNLSNTCISVLSKLDKNWLSYEQHTICPYLGIRTKYERFWPINWANINETNFI